MPSREKLLLLLGGTVLFVGGIVAAVWETRTHQEKVSPNPEVVVSAPFDEEVVMATKQVREDVERVVEP